MEKRKWLWKRRSSEKSPGETESSESISSNSERHSDEQDVLKSSPSHNCQSPEITSKAVPSAEDINASSLINTQSAEVTSNEVSAPADEIDDSLDEDVDDVKHDVSDIKEGDVNDGLRNMSEKLSAALVNVSAKEDLVKQHAKVAEEAIAGWEKAQNEVAVHKQQLEVAILRNSALEDRVTHLDGALKECVRQLRQTRDQQEKEINEAVVRKTRDLDSAKLKLENQLLELLSKPDTSNSGPTSFEIDLCHKVECLEKENSALKHELLCQSEDLEIRTIERDLSTQAAETASKQHLESIKKVAKLEAECRRLKAMTFKSSPVNDNKSTTASSFYVESLTDSHSDSGERLNAVEIDTRKMSCSDPNICEPSCSDSWATALIAELDQFKNDKNRHLPAPSVEIDLMQDFLEMERIAALPETRNSSCCLGSEVVADEGNNEDSSLKAEFDTLSHQIVELKEKLERVQAEKAELEMALIKRGDCIEASQLQLSEAEMKLEKLQRELNISNKSKQMIENQLINMEAEARTMSAKVELLDAEVDRERALSDQIAIKYEELEEELESLKQEEKIRQTASSYGELKIKQEDLAVAAEKLAECQKTIASLGNQLQSLATLEDFLIDTANLPESSANPSVIPQSNGELWRMHSNETYSPKRNCGSSSSAGVSSAPSVSKTGENSPPGSSSSTSAILSNQASSEKSRNGFAKFFSRTKSGIRLEI
ncbi:Filament-like plant protein [Quillaja saponaria]|uniref:Filament-like plant protein n=1 Tax=Quillaja saponaria TaxID=32244 RepID=A0AAD7PSK0_QUISA|nr:Filament-like plant protein [Quillaja saponaria]KAJ7965564.1 Filament-like plant protein [Quillaja saponaria]